MELYVACKKLQPRDIGKRITANASFKYLKSRTFAKNAQFLPLSVWAVSGWDAVEIRANARPEDSKIHDLGMEVFRVCIEADHVVVGSRREQAIGASKTFRKTFAISFIE